MQNIHYLGYLTAESSISGTGRTSRSRSKDTSKNNRPRSLSRSKLQHSTLHKMFKTPANRIQSQVFGTVTPKVLKKTTIMYLFITSNIIPD